MNIDNLNLDCLVDPEPQSIWNDEFFQVRTVLPVDRQSPFGILTKSPDLDSNEDLDTFYYNTEQ